MRISVFGLGYVGTVSAGCLARDGHEVVGCDIDASKLELIRQGKSPIIETGMQELIRGAVDSGRLTVTDSAREAIERSDVTFVCVGTPSLPKGGQDLTAVERVIEAIGHALRDKKDFHVVVVRSTVVPGSVEGVVRPALERASGKPIGVDWDLAFQPEFLREGSSIKDYDNPPFTVVGVDSDRAGAILKEIFEPLPCEFVTTSVPTAEMLKYCCNVFHALKITFANEIGRISQALEVDSHAVMELVCKDRQLNISPAYLRPGFAFGGSCLPKDVRALLHLAKRRDVDTPMLSGILPSNALHIEHAIDMVLESEKRTVGMIGLSFKSGTDDLRESPLVVMAERFIGKGLDLKIYDPEVQVARLSGANRRYIEESIPHISSLMSDDIREVVAGRDVVVLGLNGTEMTEAVYSHAGADQIVLDLVKIPDPSRVRGRYVGVCW